LNISTSNNNEIQEKINTNLNISLSEEKKDYEILRDYKDKSDFNFKAIMIGDPYVGKSSLINQAIKQKIIQIFLMIQYILMLYRAIEIHQQEIYFSE